MSGTKDELEAIHVRTGPDRTGDLSVPIRGCRGVLFGVLKNTREEM